MITVTDFMPTKPLIIKTRTAIMEKDKSTGTYSSIPWDYESGLGVVKEDSCNRTRKCDYNGVDDEDKPATLSDTPIKKRS